MRRTYLVIPKTKLLSQAQTNQIMTSRIAQDTKRTGLDGVHDKVCLVEVKPRVEASVECRLLACFRGVGTGEIGPFLA